MKKRYIRIAFGLNISLISAIIAVVTLDIVIMYHNSTISFICGTIFFQIACWSVLFFLNTKNWMIYYKYFWTYYTLQLKWQQIINPNISEELKKTNWYIRNIKTCGNLSYIFKLFGIIHIIGCCMCMAAMYIGLLSMHESIFILTVTIVLYSCSLVPAILFYTIIVCKTPSFDDAFYLHWECKVHRNILIMFIVSFIVIIIVIGCTQSNNIVSPIAVTSMTIVFYLMSYVSTTMIIKKNKKNTRHDKSRKNSHRPPNSDHYSSRSRKFTRSISQHSESKQSCIEKRIKLEDIYE